MKLSIIDSNMSHMVLRSSEDHTNEATTVWTVKLTKEEARAKLMSLLTAEEVTLSAELGELLRWRELEWHLIPPLSRKLILPFLTLKETLRLDTAVTEKGEGNERDHLMKAYKGLRSAGFDEWIFSSDNNFEGLRWARKRGVNLQTLKLDYKGERDKDKVLGRLVSDENKDMATFYALRSEARDVSLSCRYMRKTSTLIQSLRLGYLEVAKCLLERGADIKEENFNGETPLHWVSFNGNLELVETVLAAKAEVDKSDFHGRKALHWASRAGNVWAVTALLAAKAEVDTTNNQRESPLLRASEKGHFEVVKVLLAAGAEVDRCDNKGTTSLHLASTNGHLETVKVLLAADAKVNIRDHQGSTPLVAATHCNRPDSEEIADLLREAGAKA